MDKNFCFVKTHLLSHAIDHIRRKGPLKHYSTTLGEKGHVGLKADYQFGTDQRKGFEKKVLRIIFCFNS